MERITKQTSFRPTRHAVARLQERFYPGMSEERATQLLRQLARTARPVKLPITFSSHRQEGEA